MNDQQYAEALAYQDWGVRDPETLKAIEAESMRHGVIFDRLRVRALGGPGSGNIGHAGRPGQIGGSAPATGGIRPPGWTQDIDTNGRPIPIKVATVEEAVSLVLAGKVVEVPDVKAAHTLITKLAEEVAKMKAAGDKAKDFDLCQVTVPGSSMFCAQSLRSADYPEGVPRLSMPQIAGTPVPGTEADRLPRSSSGSVDGAEAFVKHLQDSGIAVTHDRVPASHLRASQRELVGSKVASMMNSPKKGLADKPIFISKDNYIVDGHHRWAAIVGRDAEDGVLGDHDIAVHRVDAPISEVLHRANTWSQAFGIQQKGGPSKAAN